MPDDDVTPPAPLRPAAPRRPARPEPEPVPEAEPESSWSDVGGSLADRISALADEAEDEPEPAPEAPATSAPEPPAEPAPVEEPLGEPVEAVEEVPVAEPAPVAEEPAPVAEEAPVAPVKKAPAKKAQAKKAPAKKAAAKKPVAEPRAEVAAEAPPMTEPANKAPAQKAPAKKAPAKKAPAKKVPAKKVAPVAAETVTDVVAVAPAPAVRRTPRPTPTAQLPAATEAAVDVVPGLFDGPEERVSLGGGVRLVAALAVLLLAGALGLGTAALIEVGPKTWASTTILRLSPGAAPSVNASDAVHAGQARYAAAVAGITSASAANAGVPTGDVREVLSAVPLGDDRVAVTAKARTAKEAQRLATAAVAALAQDQMVRDAAVFSPGDVLHAEVTTSSANAERVEPTDDRALLAGALVAGGVLLLALARSLLGRMRS